MGLKCSVLGHSWDDPETEREREEQGSEVVVTVRELRVCRRCGEEEVVSENKEVRSIAPPDEAGDAADTADVAPGLTGEDDAVFVDEDDAEETAVEGDAEADAAEVLAEETADDEDVEFIDEAEPGAADADTADADAAAVPDEGAEIVAEDDESAADAGDAPPADASLDADAATADPDDGVILEDEPTQESGRGHGEWPASDDVGEPEGFERDPGAWPDRDEDEAATSARRDLPDESVEDGAAAEADVERPAESMTGITSAGSAPSPSDARVGADSEFYCPECGYSAPSSRASLRVGDICPECRRGYLSERDREAPGDR